MSRHPNAIALLLVLAGASLSASRLSATDAGAAETGAVNTVEFNRDIRPILSDNCFACHGPDSASRKADLRLDRREVAMDMGSIVPGDPDSSEMIRRILSDDPVEAMPPAESKKVLSSEQKELLRRWVAEGAEYQLHWSLIPPVAGELPAVQNQGWIKNPIDHFVLARLEARGLSPAPEADRRTLARRVSLDLIGLPPAPADVEAFVNDPSEGAYEAFVDKLLQSPQWGEHRGRYWLDAARYADTHGIHFDNYREIWVYRDWVIDAFNRNLPFDQFTLEQLAGDLLPAPTLEQKIASGFNRCNITSNEGGLIPEEYLVLYTRDRTETVSQVWLGTTAGCAVCHDHKFDSFSQREFYEMSAFFNNTTQGAMDGNIQDTPPILATPKMEDRPRWGELQAEIPAVRQQLEARRGEARATFDPWLATATVEVLGAGVPREGLYVHAPLTEGTGKTAKIDVEGQPRDVTLTETSAWQTGVGGGQALVTQGAAAEIADVGDFERDQAFTCAAWIKLPANDGSGALCSRMDNANAYRGWDFWNQGRRIGSHVINRWPDDALKVVGKEQIKADEWTHVSVSYDGSGTASGVKVYYNGVPQETLVEQDRLASTIRTTVPFKIGQRNTSEPLSAGGIGDLRIYKRALSPAEIESLAKASRFEGILAKPADQRTDAEKNELYSWWLGSFDAPYQEHAVKLAALEQEQSAIQKRGTVAHVMQEKNEAPIAYILHRGEYDKREDAVTPATPAFLPPMAADVPRNRLGFAQWLLLPEQPLTARVTVNRFWQEVFGSGIVRTTGDFGIKGDPPTHPELLDWLAIEFRNGGWDVKRFFKLLVTSATYRQAALVSPEKLEQDPQNRLLSRGPRFRMDGEMVRDYALAASGLLVPKIGGPSVKPYQPEGVWEAVAMIGSNTRDYRRDTGESLYRRSMYTFWKRSAPPALLDVFNAPNRETCTVRRERTNTPLQALATLNDTTFVEAARHLAQTVLTQGGDTFEGRVDVMARRMLARPLHTEEMPVVQASLDALLGYYQAHPDDAKALVSVGESVADPAIDVATLAAWTMLANEMFNLDEVLTK